MFPCLASLGPPERRRSWMEAVTASALTRQLRPNMQGIPVQGGVFDMKLLQNIFTHLGSIQLCGCRESDVALYGLEAVLLDYRQFLKNDIPYLKV